MIPSFLFGISPFWDRTGLRVPAAEDGTSISSRLRMRAFATPVEQTDASKKSGLLHLATVKSPTSGRRLFGQAVPRNAIFTAKRCSSFMKFWMNCRNAET